MKLVSISTFIDFAKNNRLGKLYFPNGRCFQNREFVKFNIDLMELYKLLCDWTISDDWSEEVNKVPIDDIIAIIAFGSAVKQPNYTTEYYTRKKYLFWGPTETLEKRIPIKPNDADFLIITNKRMLDVKSLAPITTEVYDYGTCIKRAGIHLVNRSWDQFVYGIENNCDEISTSAIKDGVVIFGQYDPFKYSKVILQSPLSVKWSMYIMGGRVEGEIE